MLGRHVFRLPMSLLIAAGIIACSEAPTGAEAPGTSTEAPADAGEAPEAEIAYDAVGVDFFLRDYAEDAGATGNVRTRTAVAPVPGSDLVVAYLMGPFWCGSGGCSLLVLRPGEEGWEIVGDVSVVQTPVRLLTSSSNGLPDLGVRVAGGGAEPHEALLAFDGEAYPANASMPPARPIADAEGRVLISDEDRGQPLFE